MVYDGDSSYSFILWLSFTLQGLPAFTFLCFRIVFVLHSQVLGVGGCRGGQSPAAPEQTCLWPRLNQSEMVVTYLKMKEKSSGTDFFLAREERSKNI